MKNRAITSYMGALLAVTGCVYLFPFASLLFFPGDARIAAVFAAIGVLFLLAGMLLWKIFKQPSLPPPTVLDTALILVAVSLLAVVSGAVPFWVSGSMGLLDGLFESMSGWTTTGLTMLNPDETAPIILFWRAVMQFFGGAAFATAMLAGIVGGLGPGAFEAEARKGSIIPNLKAAAGIVLKIYPAYFIAGASLYYLSGMDLFDAICHSFSGISTGGFSTRSAGIAFWGSWRIETVSMFLMIAGTVSFATHHAILSSFGRKGWRDSELRLTLYLITAYSLLLMFFLPETGSRGFNPLFRTSLFHVVSAVSGTGYATASIASWAGLPVFLTILMMIFVGGTGSTSGGIKLYRAAIMVKSMVWWIKKQFYPSSAVIRNSIWRRGELLEIEDRHMQAVSAFIGIYLLTYAAGVFVFILSGYSLQDSLLEFASAIGNVGLTAGETSPEMPAACKIAQILGMGLGRLEFIAVFHAVIRIAKRTK